MTDIIFSFDVEDLSNLDGLDGILRTAEILRRHDVRGCFQIVGRLAEIIEQKGRTDIIEALKYHEIDDHSLLHSLHPTINELTDLEDYDEAHDLLMARQQENHDIIRRIFGVDKIHSFCPPGLSLSYVGYYVAAELGEPIYCGGNVYDVVHNRPAYFCNALCTNYDTTLEETLTVRDENYVPVRLRTNEELIALYDKIAEERVLEVTFHHPSMSMYTEWWDEKNCSGKNPEKMVESNRVSDEFIEGYYERFDWLVGYIKSNKKFRITNYENIAKQYDDRELIVTKRDIPWIKSQLEEKFHPTTLPRSLCMSDIFHICRAFLQGRDTYKRSFVHGFLEEPFAVSRPVTVTKEEMVESAKALTSYGWLPLSIDVGGKKLGPADWIRAALGVLSGENEVTVQPGPWQIDLTQFPRLSKFNPTLWIIETPESMKNNYLTKRGVLQSWTIRLPEGTNRLVYFE